MTTTTTTVGWHGDPDLKARKVADMVAHRAADDLVGGTYGRMLNGGNPRFGGCFHACLTVEELAREQGVTPLQVARDTGGYELHEAGERLWGIPRRLGAVLDAVFERSADKGAFAVAATGAVPVGADLSVVVDRWVLAILVDPERGVIRYGTEGSAVRAAIESVAALYRRRLDGDEPTYTEWRAARSAAYAADAADAAAYAADAAYAAAAAAADAAAAAAYAAADAGASARAWQEHLLLDLIAAA